MIALTQVEVNKLVSKYESALGTGKGDPWLQAHNAVIQELSLQLRLAVYLDIAEPVIYLSTESAVKLAKVLPRLQGE